MMSDIYLTEKQEDKVYKEVYNIFENKNGECTNCETNFITENRNYFEMYSDIGCFNVEFKTKNGKLLKRSLIIKTV